MLDDIYQIPDALVCCIRENTYDLEVDVSNYNLELLKNE